MECGFEKIERESACKTCSSYLTTTGGLVNTKFRNKIIIFSVKVI